jgi:AmmeMemoRadiSam system protein A
MTDQLTQGEQQVLLRLAREAMECGVRGKELPPYKEPPTPRLLEDGASFVTLTINHELRGCIGALEAYQPLVDDVREHAISAALHDPRFPPVDESELSRIHIEVSRLSAPRLLEYTSGEDLLARLNPHVDGVILKDGYRRATFLPQVWDQIPDPSDFLSHLCVKMGARKNLWRDTKLEVYIYHVEEFHESSGAR